jgi:OPA family glycerol-3-phosphate transporter-like MFS transporter/OPA family sugar phosphate sensor protein UhpC-like MFS transporter
MADGVASTVSVLRPRFPRMLRLFEPAPPAVPLTDPAAIRDNYRVWQRRVLISSIIGYAVFYFVRKNLSIAMPLLERDLGISKSDLGLFLTLHGVLYGISKFANGFFGDRCNARAFMVVGLTASALMNVFFGLGSAVVTLGMVWMLNGWFQGMGFPPCARLMTHWFTPKEFATKFSVWNTSHSIGAGLILVLCGSVLAPISWRACFLVPAVIALVCALYLWLTLPDTPPSVGLPEVEGTQTEMSEQESGAQFRAFLVRAVFRNKYIWLVSLANFFVYTLRYGMLDWGPTLLTQAKHLSISSAGWMVAAFEAAGVLGAVLSGWLTDRYFGGRAMRVGLIYMVLAGVSVLAFWKLAGQSVFWNTALLCASGFFIYGPQCLVGVAAAKLATKHAAATAVGLTGLFGYASTVLSGWGLGWLVERHGWDAGLAGLTAVAAVGTVLFALAWRAQAHGYAAEADGPHQASRLASGGV